MDRFPALTLISILLKVLAVITGIGGVIAAFVIGGGAGIAEFVVAAIGVLVLWAYAEIIAVFLAIEENTNQTYQMLRTSPASSSSDRPAWMASASSLANAPIASPRPSRPSRTGSNPNRPYKDLADQLELRQQGGD